MNPQRSVRQVRPDSKVLVIPHVSVTGARIRSWELATRLARFFDVYYLTWSPRKYGAPRRLDRLRAELGDALRRARLAEEDGVHVIRCSTLYHGGPAAAWYNSHELRRLIVRFGIDVVINAGKLFSPRFEIPVPYVFDLVDDHAAGCLPRHRPSIESWIAREIQRADAVTTVSHQLVKLVKERYQHDAIYLPNGADFSPPDCTAINAAQCLRSSLGLEGRFVIGYIGHHGEWSGLPFLVETFTHLRRVDPAASLLVVGGGSDADRLAAGGVPEGVLLVGPVPPRQVRAHFLALDLGVLPFARNAFTDSAMPLKILEYAAARKLVVATPLTELATLRLPNVLLTESQVATWVQALSQARDTRWQPAWLAHFQPFEWTRIAARLARIVQDLIHRNRERLGLSGAASVLTGEGGKRLVGELLYGLPLRACGARR